VTLSDTVSSVTLSNNVRECVANIDSVLSIVVVDCRKSISVLSVYMLSVYTIIIHLLQFQPIDCSVGQKLYSYKNGTEVSHEKVYYALLIKCL